jgi:6-pyruvoyltetrahydropterin/6-carboxytetrahydropterin synthase
MTVTGDLIDTKGDSSEGMVIDFGDIKEVMKVHVHDVLDHGFMYYKDDLVMKKAFITAERENMGVNEDEEFNIIAVDFIPTAENIVKMCFDAMWPHLPTGVTISRLRLYETPNSWADYRPRM